MRSLIPCVVLVLGGVVACTGGREPLHEPTAPQAPLAVPAATLDVPALLSLTIDQLPERMGPVRSVPPDFVDRMRAAVLIRADSPDSVRFFRWQGMAMVATYNHRTRHLIDLVLLGSNENELMRRGQLRLGALNYLVLPIFELRQPTRLLGLRVLATALNE